MLIDTHCHLTMMVKKKFDVPLNEAELHTIGTIVEDAKKHHVETIITVGTNVIESHNSIEVAKRYPHVYATVGLHPTDCTANWQKDLSEIKTLLEQKDKNKIVGIGECGLDFYWPGHDAQRQKDAFKAQIELALEYDLPLTIHMRNSSEEMLYLLEEFKGHIKGVLHSFCQDQAIADQLKDLGLLLGIGGVITYPKNDKLRETIKHSSPESIVLETDAPWLPPQSERGKQNHPKYIKTIAEYIADLKNISFEQVANETTKNARNLFQLTLPKNQ